MDSDERKKLKRKRTEDVVIGCVTKPNQPVDLVFNQLIDDLFDDCASGTQQVPDDLVFELLTRLPFKKLLQCMCVSKAWCSIICQPKFIRAYRNSNPCCLVISIPDLDPDIHGSSPYSRPRRIYSSTLGAREPPEDFNELFNVNSLAEWDCGALSAVVNGLFCYYSGNTFFLRHAFTGETMKLPDLPSADSSTVPHFGFDPVNRVYKLLYIRKFTRECKILTLARNSSWRDVFDEDKYSKYIGKSRSFWVDGVLYWIHHWDESMPCGLVSFNLSQEVFGYYSFLTDDRLYPRLISRSYLVQFRGWLSLFTRVGKKMIFHALEHCRGNGENWTRHEAILPSEFWHDKNFSAAVPVGNLPTAEILLASLDLNPRIIPVYSYNRENNRFERFVVGQLPEFVRLRSRWDVTSVVSCTEQNFATLDAIIHGA